MDRKQSIPVTALVDCGATGLSFIDIDFARSQNYCLQPLYYPRTLTVFDGRETVSGRVTHIVHVTFHLGNHRHTERLSAFVTKLSSSHQIVLGLPWLKRHNPYIDWERESMTFASDYCTRKCIEPLPQNNDTSETRPPPLLEIRAIGAAPFASLASKPDVELFAITMQDIEKALAKKEPTNPATKLPTEYHDFLDVFSKDLASKLPPHRGSDHKIPLQPGAAPAYGPLYNMSREELLVLKKYLDENLEKGFIRPSSSPAASPVLFVRKPGGGLRFCVDYRGLNALTIKNRYPLPLINETLARISRAKYFTKLDIVAAFNKLRMAKGEEWKTAFRTRYGLYEYLVMPFGLANAPSSFQNYINDVLREWLDDFVTAYIDDILIYSDNLEDHRRHVRIVLQALREAGLQIDIDKCEFHQSSVKYLGLIIGSDGIKMDPTKVEAILSWGVPTNLKEVQGFLGFANFYRRFIKNFSRVVGPLTDLTKKGRTFAWSAACNKAFVTLKNAFLRAPILQPFDFDKPARVECDASDGATGAVLSQPDATGFWRPVAYLSSRMTLAECNYDIYDKELLAIVKAFEQWRAELEGSPFGIEVHSDHKNLVYFMRSKLLNRRQARWSEFLSRFEFRIAYTPGSFNTRADALSRRPGDLPLDRGEDGRRLQHQVLLKSHQLSPKVIAEVNQPLVAQANDLFHDDLSDDSSSKSSTDEDSASSTVTNTSSATEVDDEGDIQALIDQGYENDDFTKGLLRAIKDHEPRYEDFSLSEFTLHHNRLLFRDRLFVPDYQDVRTQIIRAAHDLPAAGHPGIAKTLSLVQRSYYWPLLHRNVQRYVKSCRTCHRAKPSRERYHGLLKPLEVPPRRWAHVSMDFIVDLPRSKTNAGVSVRNILVVVDRLTKMRHLIPCNSMTALETARLFYEFVWKLHGIPDTIVSDRGPQFVSDFWTRLCDILRIKLALSTAYHPETDGQTESSNCAIEQILRCFCNQLQDDWASWCPSAEFAMNNWESSSTSISPFFANYGQHPKMGFEPVNEVPNAVGGRRALEMFTADDFARHMEQVQTCVQDEMRYAQAVYEEHANRHRQPAPQYKVGDQVYLSSRNIRTLRPSKKLDWKQLGPYPIIEKVSSHAYRLQLPANMKIHNVFHVNLLRPNSEDPLLGQELIPPPPVLVEGELKWQVEDVIRHRFTRHDGHEYLVRWKGWDENDNTWEPFDHVKHLTDLLWSFHQRHTSHRSPFKDGSLRRSSA